MTSIIEVKNLLKRYGKKVVLRDISFEVGCGEIFVLLGPNGAGKTTTVKILSGVLDSDGGEVLIKNCLFTPKCLEIKKSIGYLPDEPYIYNYLTGREFLEFISSIYRTKFEDKELEYYLKVFEMQDCLDDIVDNYSKGMKQKLLLMSIFLRKPEIYILDEPLAGLDPQSISYLKQYLVRMVNDGRSVVLCTHLLELAESLATRLAIIYNGEILMCGKKEELAIKLSLPVNVSLEQIYLSVINKVK